MSALKAEIFLDTHVNKAGTKMRSVPQILSKQAFVCLFKPTFVWVTLIWKNSNKLQFLNEYTRPHLNIHQAATTLNLLTGEVNHILWKTVLCWEALSPGIPSKDSCRLNAYTLLCYQHSLTAAVSSQHDETWRKTFPGTRSPPRGQNF